MFDDSLLKEVLGKHRTRLRDQIAKELKLIAVCVDFLERLTDDLYM